MKEVARFIRELAAIRPTAVASAAVVVATAFGLNVSVEGLAGILAAVGTVAHVLTAYLPKS